jgi:hypothetical protein
LWQRILTDELPWLKPGAWIQSMQAAASRLGGIDAATDVIEKDVLRAWGAPIGEISAALFLDKSENPIREELSLRSRPKDVARRMILHGSLDRLGLELFGCTETEQRALPLFGTAEDRPPTLPNASVDRLLRVADLCGLPLASIKLAELNSNFARAAQAIGVDDSSFRSFAAILEVNVLQGMMESLHFSAESWVANELAMRRRLGGARNRRRRIWPQHELTSPAVRVESPPALP